MPLPFEFIIDGPPVSQQARRTKRVLQWKQEVRRAAQQVWPAGELPVTEPVMIAITYFYGGASMDVDNIPKPVLDALKGLVYMDDEQLTDITCRKRDLNASLRVTNSSSVLAEGLGRGNEFLCVVVKRSLDQEVID